jgi:hypothetical protein
MTYHVKFTDKNKVPIGVTDNDINIDNTDITLLGRTKLDYGQDLNANLLHILENFACEEDITNIGNPDLSKTSTLADTSKKLLSTPIEGQMWWNKTQRAMFLWDGNRWNPIAMQGDLAVNWGIVCDGEQIPRPQSDNGYIFDYSECVWIISPIAVEFPFEYIVCYTDAGANVTMKYGLSNSTVVDAPASFMIVGIRGNINLGHNLPVPPP